MTEASAAWNARRRAERVASGKCRDCGTEADGYRCDKCKKIAAAWQRKRRERK